MSTVSLREDSMKETGKRSDIACDLGELFGKRDAEELKKLTPTCKGLSSMLEDGTLEDRIDKRMASKDEDVVAKGMVVSPNQTKSTSVDHGSCQGRCRFFHAAIAIFFPSPCFDLFGFRCTVFSGVQFRVDPDQRSGCSFLAVS